MSTEVQSTPEGVIARHSAPRRRPIDVMFIGLRSINGGQGGVEKHVACLVEEYERRGIQTCVIERSPYATKQGRRYVNSWTKTLWSPKKASLEALVHSVIATFYAASVRPQILHVHAIGPSLIVPLARLLGLRVVCTHHGKDYDREKWGKFARLSLRLGEHFQARFGNACICVSNGLAASLSDKYHRLFAYIPNAVRMPTRPLEFDALAQFGLEPGRYIVNVSRLVPEKRQIDLIEAYKALNRSDIKLALVGGVDHASDYSERLRELAAATPGVVMTGFQSGSTLAQLTAGAAVFALPSSHEGMPIAALEAMSMYRPLVLSNIDANKDLGLPGECYHEVASVPSLTQTLRRTLERHQHQSLPSYDWSAVLSAYSWSMVAEKTLGIYSQICASFTRATGPFDQVHEHYR